MLMVSFSNRYNSSVQADLLSRSIGTIIRTLQHTASRMKQELARGRSGQDAEIPDIPLWVAVNLSIPFSTLELELILSLINRVIHSVRLSLRSSTLVVFALPRISDTISL